MDGAARHPSAAWALRDLRGSRGGGYGGSTAVVVGAVLAAVGFFLFARGAGR